MTAFLLLAALALGLAPPEGSSIRGLGEPERRWIPIELHRDRWIFLKGHVNGVETEILLDSGAGMTVMSQSEAQRRGFRGGRRAIAEGVGGSQNARIYGGVFVEAGPLSLRDLRVAAVDLSEVEAHLGRSVPMVLGREAFGRAVVDIDYPNRRLSFLDPKSFEHDGAGTTVPLHPFDEGKWAVDLVVEGRGPGRFQLDTGSGQTLTLFDGFVREHGLLEERLTSRRVSGGVGGMVEVRSGTLAEVTFGDATMTDVPVAFHTGDVGLFATMNDDGALDGNLGAGILERFRLIFDPLRRELHLQPASLGAPFERDRSGLQTRKVEDGLLVIHVAPDSPAAEGGWQTGMVIRSIDGTRVGPDYWEKLYGWQLAAPGTRVDLVDLEGNVYELVLEDYF